MQQTNSSTASGQTILYREPWKTPIHPDDLFQHLSRVIRYAGARPVTVLDHLALCVLIAERRGYEVIPRAYVAAHDLQEAFLLDLPRGLKECLPEYRQLEDRWEHRIHEHFGLPWPPPQPLREMVKAIDHAALVVEMTATHHPRLKYAVEAHGAPIRDELNQWSLLQAQPDHRKWWLVLQAVETGVRALMRGGQEPCAT